MGHGPVRRYGQSGDRGDCGLTFIATTGGVARQQDLSAKDQSAPPTAVQRSLRADWTLLELLSVSQSAQRAKFSAGGRCGLIFRYSVGIVVIAINVSPRSSYCWNIQMRRTGPMARPRQVNRGALKSKMMQFGVRKLTGRAKVAILAYRHGLAEGCYDYVRWHCCSCRSACSIGVHTSPKAWKEEMAERTSPNSQAA